MTSSSVRFVFVALTLSACFDARGGLPLNQWSAEYARVLCARAVECCAESELERIAGPERDCRAHTEANFDDLVQTIENDIAMGYTTHDGHAALRCVQYLEEARCGLVWGGEYEPSPCERIWVYGGHDREPGEPCDSNFECISNECGVDGTCAPSLALGDPCVSADHVTQCAPGLVCLEGMCRPWPASCVPR